MRARAAGHGRAAEGLDAYINKRKADKTTEVTTKGKGKTKVFDFTGLELGGRLRTPQLLYFLDRAEQELDRAALEKRSFIPEMARSMEEEAL